VTARPVRHAQVNFAVKQLQLSTSFNPHWFLWSFVLQDLPLRRPCCAKRSSRWSRRWTPTAGLPDDAVDLIGGESQLPFPTVAAVSRLLQSLSAIVACLGWEAFICSLSPTILPGWHNQPPAVRVPLRVSGYGTELVDRELRTKALGDNSRLSSFSKLVTAPRFSGLPTDNLCVGV